MRMFFVALLASLLYANTSLAVCVLGIGKCRAGFVRLHPVETTGRQASTAVPDEGYLHIVVNSNTDALAANERFGRLDKGLVYLSVTAEITFADGQRPELPILLYDLDNRSEVTVDAYQLGRAQFIHLRSGFQPTVTFHVRAIPSSIARSYAQAFQTFDRALGNTPARALLGSIPQLTLATDILSGFSTAVIDDTNRHWASSRRVGLTSAADQTLLPLSGDPVILFLVPTAEYDTTTLGTGTFTVNRGTVLRDGKKFVDLPYFVLQARTSQYRPLSPDFISSPLSCSTPESELTAIDEVLKSGNLTNKQRDYEQLILERLRILHNVQKPSARQSIDELATSAHALLTLPRPSDSFWSQHYATSAASLDGCIQNVINRNLTVADRWERLRRAFGAARTWQENSRTTTDSERRSRLERSLRDVVMPIATYSLSTGDAYSYLANARRDIEAQLVPYYDAYSERARTAKSNTEVAQLVADINQAIAATDCGACRDTLKQISSDLAIKSQLAAAEAALVAERKRVAELQAELAEKLSTARAIATVTETIKIADAPAAALQSSVVETSQLLRTASPSEQALESAIRKVELTTAAVQSELAKPEQQKD